MKKGYMIKGVFLFILLMLSFSSPASALEYRDLDSKTDISTDKKWTIRFNDNLDKSTINHDSIYVEDINGERIPVKFSFQEENSVIVESVNPYIPGSDYTIFVTDKIKSAKGKFINRPTKMNFTIKKSEQISENMETLKPILVKDNSDIQKALKDAVAERRHFVLFDMASINVQEAVRKIWDEVYRSSNPDMKVISTLSINHNTPSRVYVCLDYKYFLDNSLNYFDCDLNLLVTLDKKVLLTKESAKVNLQYLKPSNNMDISYTVENESIATVDNRGNVTALSKGETTINVKVILDKGNNFKMSYNLPLTIQVLGDDAVIINTVEDLKNAIKNNIGKDSVDIYIARNFGNVELDNLINEDIINDLAGRPFYLYTTNNFTKIEYNYPAEITKEEFLKRYKEVNDKVDSILSSIIKPGMDEIEKEMAIHNYVVLNTQYDYENLLNGTIPYESYTPYGILINGTGVCDGYAKTMCLLLNKVGIECKRVTGTANGGGHAWNLVKINGKYYYLDATWDDPITPTRDKNFIRYTYFNVTEAEIRKTHSFDKGQNLPPCTDTTFDYLRN